MCETTYFGVPKLVQEQWVKPQVSGVPKLVE